MKTRVDEVGKDGFLCGRLLAWDAARWVCMPALQAFRGHGRGAPPEPHVRALLDDLHKASAAVGQSFDRTTPTTVPLAEAALWAHACWATDTYGPEAVVDLTM